MSVPINEQETTISFMRNSDKAIVYTPSRYQVIKNLSTYSWKGKINENFTSTNL